MVKRLKPSTEVKPSSETQSSLWFDINPREGDAVASVKSRVSVLKDAESRVASLSSQTLSGHQKAPKFSYTLSQSVPKVSSTLRERTPEFSTLNEGVPKVSSTLRQGAPKLFSRMNTELDKSLLLLQVQGQKLDNILENLGTLSDKLPEMTSCECDCVSGSGDDVTELPVTLQHLKSNIERLKKAGTTDKEIVIAVFTAMYSGLEVRFQIFELLSHTLHYPSICWWLAAYGCFIYKGHFWILSELDSHTHGANIHTVVGNKHWKSLKIRKI